MQPLRLRIRLLARRPSDDDAEGEHLASLVRSAVERRAAAPIAVVIRAERTELIELRPVVEAEVPLPMFMAGLTRSEPEGFGLPLAVGLAGRFRASTPSGGAPVALAFLEWPDCRWARTVVERRPKARKRRSILARRAARDGPWLVDRSLSHLSP